MTRGHSLDRRSLALAAVSTVVEWYDFTLFLYLATLLSRIFFTGSDGVIVALAGFAVAYLMRPVGAMVFGHLGDCHGRRKTLLASMTLMTVAMALTAALPTARQIGPASGALLLLLRCVMGFAVGGEYTGVIAYLLEGAPTHHRGLVTSVAAVTSEIGGLLAAAASALTVSLLPAPEVESWGWRLPFVFGAMLAGCVLVVRGAMRESPEFEAKQGAGQIVGSPLTLALRHHWRGVIRGFAISALGSITYYVGITYVPVYLTSFGKVDEGQALRLATYAALAVIVVTPLFGHLSDRFGPKPVLIGLALVSAPAPYLLFALLSGPAPTVMLIAALLLAAIAGGVSAVGPVATAEQMPVEGRLSGLALGNSSATALFGGFTPLIAQLLSQKTQWTLAPGLMITLVAVTVLPVLLFLPETRPLRDISADRDSRQPWRDAPDREAGHSRPARAG